MSSDLPPSSPEPPLKPQPIKEQPPYPSRPSRLTSQEVLAELGLLLKDVVILVLQGLSRLLAQVAKWVETPPKPASDAAQGVSNTVQTVGQDIWKNWRSLLQPLRRALPDSVNRQLADDRLLLAAIAAALLTMLWLGSAILSPKPATPNVATTPTKPAPTISQKPVPAKPSPTAAKPSDTSQTSPSRKPFLKQKEQPEKATRPSAQSDLAQSAPNPVPSPLVPSRSLKLTPEQKLIARIQEQAEEVTNQYSTGLIQAIQANFRDSRLIVKLGSAWYGLTPSQQNQLASELRQRAQELDFSKLEIADSQGTLLARSPVVGTEMIILKRETQLKAS